MGCLYIQLRKEKMSDVVMCLNYWILNIFIFFMWDHESSVVYIWKYVRAIYSWLMHKMCKPYDADMITDSITSTNKILGSVMYCVRLLYKRVTDNVIKPWHIHQPSYKEQYYNTTQVCHPLLTSCQVLHSLIVCSSCYHLHWYY